MNNKIFNKEEISNRKRHNIYKAIEIILSECATKNREVINILKNIDQQSPEFIEIQNYVLSDNISCSELYEKFNYYNKSIVTLVLTNIIKNNIKFCIIEKNNEEVDILPKTMLDIESEPQKYKIYYADSLSCYEQYADIFSIKNDNVNIFTSLARNLKEWFFSLSPYVTAMEKEYLGRCKYKVLEKEITYFKNSLKGSHISPYWYISKKLVSIFQNNIPQKLSQTKHIVDNSLEKIKKVLSDDINYLFPDGLYNWYNNLSENLKLRVYKDEEEKFLEICKRSRTGYNIDEIILYITGLKIEYWNDNTPEIFYKELETLKNTIEDTKHQELSEGFKISCFQAGKCVKKKIYFSSSSKNIDIIKKDILSVMDNYGKSIKHSEKIGAILEIAFMSGDEVI